MSVVSRYSTGTLSSSIEFRGATPSIAVGRVTPSETRREYVPVGSEPASLLATVSAGITHPTTSVSWILVEKSTCV